MWTSRQMCISKLDEISLLKYNYSRNILQLFSKISSIYQLSYMNICMWLNNFYDFFFFFPSDGVGRTGSYLLLDMVLNRISKGAKEIDIAATLEHIRDQRAGAVCTKQQFQFVLSAVAEEVQAVLRALPQQQPTTQEQAPDSGLPISGQPQANGGQHELIATTSAATACTNGSQAQGQVAGGQPLRKQSK